MLFQDGTDVSDVQYYCWELSKICFVFHCHFPSLSSVFIQVKGVIIIEVDINKKIVYFWFKLCFVLIINSVCCTILLYANIFTTDYLLSGGLLISVARALLVFFIMEYECQNWHKLMQVGNKIIFQPPIILVGYFKNATF